MELTKVRANMTIDIFVDCPNDDCRFYINLMDESDTNGINHNDEGYILRQSCPSGDWSERHEKFEVEEVVCSQCKTEFKVSGLDW